MKCGTNQEDTDSESNPKTYRISAAHQKGTYVCIKNHPCEVISFSVLGTGYKCKETKARIVGKDIFTNKTHEEVCPLRQILKVPVITKVEYPLIHINHDGYLGLLKSDNMIKEDLKLPEGELGKQIKNMYEEGKSLRIEVMSAMDQEAIVSVKEVEDEDYNQIDLKESSLVKRGKKYNTLKCKHSV